MTPELTAIGMLESTCIARGIEAADQMLKTAGVAPLFFKTICPGKYAAAISGDVAAVIASIEAGKTVLAESLADWFVIPNIHPDIPVAFAGLAPMPKPNALGILETFSAASIILAADAAAKAASVHILDVRLAMGLGGKGYALLVGDVAAVEASVNAGAQAAAQSGLLVAKTVIPQPSEELWECLA